MIKKMKISVVAIALSLLAVSGLSAQTIKEGSITTAGADCSVSTRCSELIDMKGIPSIGIIIDIGTSGTFQFEYSLDATSLTTGTWTALIDDVDGASSTTADVSPKFFTNPGYKFVRIRASAISGNATYKVLRGSAPLRSTASITGGGDASLTEQQNQTTHLATLAGAVAGTEVQVDIISGSVTASATNTDADAATIAQGQTSDTVNNLNFIHDGSAWARLTFGQTTMSASLPVTIASNQSAIPITDNSGSLTVDAPVGTPAFVRLSDGSSAITTLPVSLASVPSHAVTNAGTFATQAAQSGTWTFQPGNTANTTAWLVTGTGGTFPATQSGTWNVATLTTLTGGGIANNSADSGNPVKVGGRYNATPITLDDGDRGDVQLDAKGSLKILNVDTNGIAISPGVACNNVAIINTAASGNTQLVAISSTTTIYVCSYVITAEATVDVRLVKGTGTACATDEESVTGTFAFSTTTGLLGVSRGSGLGMITKTDAADALCIETSGAIQINGEVTYAQY